MCEHILFVPRMVFMEVLCSVAHYHNLEYICPPKGVVFFDKCVAVNIPELAGRMLYARK